MKTLLLRSILSLLILTGFFNSCNKEDETLSTYDMICCEWTVTDIQYDLRVNDLSFVDYIMVTNGISEEEAQEAFEENQKAYKEFWTGTMHFYEHDRYEFNMGEDIYSSSWYLSDDEKTIHVLFTGYYMNFDIISVDENNMNLQLRQTFYFDIDGDGIKDTIKYLNGYTLEK